MKFIYLLKLKDSVPFDYDTHDGHVIVAGNQTEARKMAAEKSAGEGPNWSDPERSTCEVLALVSSYTASRVLLSSFNAG